MNKNIKKTVKEILSKDEYARNNDKHLIKQVIIKMLGIGSRTAFEDVLDRMEQEKISFEGITRARRKVQEENPHLRAKKEIEKARCEEEENYFLEYSNHIPRID